MLDVLYLGAGGKCAFIPHPFLWIKSLYRYSLSPSLAHFMFMRVPLQSHVTNWNHTVIIKPMNGVLSICLQGFYIG